uniref:Uncharacterized protein n=1 Tax=Anguilla anguilla TaxID=7936 RepID=A0A0E9SL48_ANGAN
MKIDSSEKSGKKHCLILVGMGFSHSTFLKQSFPIPEPPNFNEKDEVKNRGEKEILCQRRTSHPGS